jgi:hypothetical protein
MWLLAAGLGGVALGGGWLLARSTRRREAAARAARKAAGFGASRRSDGGGGLLSRLFGRKGGAGSGGRGRNGGQSGGGRGRNGGLLGKVFGRKSKTPGGGTAPGSKNGRPDGRGGLLGRLFGRKGKKPGGGAAGSAGGRSRNGQSGGLLGRLFGRKGSSGGGQGGGRSGGKSKNGGKGKNGPGGSGSGKSDRHAGLLGKVFGGKSKAERKAKREARKAGRDHGGLLPNGKPAPGLRNRWRRWLDGTVQRGQIKPAAGGTPPSATAGTQDTSNVPTGGGEAPAAQAARAARAARTTAPNRTGGQSMNDVHHSHDWAYATGGTWTPENAADFVKSAKALPDALDSLVAHQRKQNQAAQDAVFLKPGVQDAQESLVKMLAQAQEASSDIYQQTRRGHAQQIEDIEEGDPRKAAWDIKQNTGQL